MPFSEALFVIHGDRQPLFCLGVVSFQSVFIDFLDKKMVYYVLVDF